jgi:Short C-terminal domain
MLMKKLIVSTVVALSFVVLLNGCIAIGTGPKSQQTNAILGQQLIDLKTAQANGAITDAEYQTQKAKLLGNTPETTPAK